MLAEPGEKVTSGYVYFPLSCLDVKRKDLPSYPLSWFQLGQS